MSPDDDQTHEEVPHKAVTLTSRDPGGPERNDDPDDQADDPHAERHSAGFADRATRLTLRMTHRAAPHNLAARRGDHESLGLTRGHPSG